jgi:hypothetical protein
MWTVVCWGIVTLAAVLMASGFVLDAMRIRDDGRLCPWWARLMAIWTAPR